MAVIHLFSNVMPMYQGSSLVQMSQMNVPIRPNTYYLLSEFHPLLLLPNASLNSNINTYTRHRLVNRDMITRKFFSVLCSNELFGYEQHISGVRHRLVRMHIADANCGLLLSICNLHNLLLFQSYLNDKKQLCTSIQKITANKHELPSYIDFFANPNLTSRQNDQKDIHYHTYHTYHTYYDTDIDIEYHSHQNVNKPKSNNEEHEQNTYVEAPEYEDTDD
jgi:hypothetical protein